MRGFAARPRIGVSVSGHAHRRSRQADRTRKVGRPRQAGSRMAERPSGAPLTGLEARKQCSALPSRTAPSLRRRDAHGLVPERVSAKEENVMADFSRVLTRRSSDCGSPTTRKAPLPIPVFLAVAAFALAGCNANQTPNPSGQANLGAIYPNYNPYNPASYAQTSGFYAGR